MNGPAEVARGLGAAPFRGLTLVRGERSTVWDATGRAFLDAGGASFGTMNVGHAHPRVRAAIERAAGGLTHASQTYAHAARSAFVDRVLAFAGPWAERAFLSNSGSEAVETAIKIAMAATGRSGVVAFEGAFHGRTLGALSATHKAAYRDPFSGRLSPTTFVPYGSVDALARAVTRETACVLVEPIQGEGGVRVPREGFLRAARDVARDAGALLVVDEVQTGLGRTGHDLAIHGARVEPDLLCLAKSIAAGLPLGVTLASGDVPRLSPGQHGSTFGGSPLVCEVASDVLSIVAEERLAVRARDTGSHLAAALSDLDDPLIREVRGTGLMIGLELSAQPTPVLRALQDLGVLALPAGANVVRLLPPLVLTTDEADRIVDALRQSLRTVVERFAAQAVSP